jgi:hypothetical protein
VAHLYETPVGYVIQTHGRRRTTKTQAIMTWMLGRFAIVHLAPS